MLEGIRFVFVFLWIVVIPVHAFIVVPSSHKPIKPLLLSCHHYHPKRHDYNTLSHSSSPSSPSVFIPHSTTTTTTTTTTAAAVAVAKTTARKGIVRLAATESEETESTEENNNNVKKNNLPMLLDPGTKGGILFLSFILFLLPILVYNIATNNFGLDGIEIGKYIGVGFTLITTLLWVSTYIFRVATKDMTYAKQLKDYENAVIAKRLEELDEDEVQALVEDIERDNF